MTTEYIAQVHRFWGEVDHFRWYIWIKGAEPRGPFKPYDGERNAVAHGQSMFKFLASWRLKQAYARLLASDETTQAPTMVVDLGKEKIDRAKIAKELRKVEKNVQKL